MTFTPRRPARGTTRGAALALAAVATLGLAGCGTAPSPSGTDTASVARTSAAPLILTDGWVKAVESLSTPSPSMSPMSGASSTATPTGGTPMSAPMTAMFGTLTNTTDTELTVTGGSCAVAAMVQLHETVINSSGVSQMQQKPGGYVIPAHGTLVLKPGGNHVMLMNLMEPLKNGSTVTVNLETSAGPVPFTVPVRTFTGANETYNASPSS